MWWARRDAGRRGRARRAGRVAVLPGAVLLCALAALSACGGPAAPAQATGTGAPSGPGATGGRLPPSTTAATPTSCVEPQPDAGPVDLVAVTLDRSPDGLVVTYELRGPAVTSFDMLQLSVGLWAEDGAAQRSFGVRWVHGEPTLLVYDPTAADETDLPGRPTVHGDTVTVRFPPSAIDGLMPTDRWEAYASVDGTQVDECPGR